MSSLREKVRARAADLELGVHALYVACHDPRVPWYAKALAACVVAYALSPIDLIPDPIPVLGYLDDLILLPLGVNLALRLVPADLRRECWTQAAAVRGTRRPKRWVAACIVMVIWAATAVFAVGLAGRMVP